MDNNISEARTTSFGWMVQEKAEPKKCRRCGRVWVTGHVVCAPCAHDIKYERSNYYFLRTNEIATLDMGVPLWA